MRRQAGDCGSDWVWIASKGDENMIRWVRVILLGITVLVSSALTGTLGFAQAERYPAKPITMLVGRPGVPQTCWRARLWKRPSRTSTSRWRCSASPRLRHNCHSTAPGFVGHPIVLRGGPHGKRRDSGGHSPTPA